MSATQATRRSGFDRPSARRRLVGGAGWRARKRPARIAVSWVTGNSSKRPASRISVNHPSASTKRLSAQRRSRPKKISATVGAATRTGLPADAASAASRKRRPSGFKPEATEVSQTGTCSRSVAVDEDRFAHLLRRGKPCAGVDRSGFRYRDAAPLHDPANFPLPLGALGAERSEVHERLVLADPEFTRDPRDLGFQNARDAQRRTTLRTTPFFGLRQALRRVSEGGPFGAAFSRFGGFRFFAGGFRASGCHWPERSASI